MKNIDRSWLRQLATCQATVAYGMIANSKPHSSSYEFGEGMFMNIIGYLRAAEEYDLVDIIIDRRRVARGVSNNARNVY